MTVHISAFTGCNLGCTYCYETADRERGENWAQSQYDMESIMDQLRRMKEKYPNETPGMFGGEPLLMKNEHLERIFKWVYENYDSGAHIQTNGTLIDDEVIEMFKKYDVDIGVSCDGPVELNRERLASGELEEDEREMTDNMSQRTLENIKRLNNEEGLSAGLIVVLHKTNAGTEERFEKLLDWMDELAQEGISGHFNPAIPYENIQTGISLDPETLKKRYLRTWEWIKEEPYRNWGPMQTYVDNLLGLSLRNCVNNKCDVFNTQSAKMVMGNGETTGCGKTWSQVGDGAKFLQGPSTGNEYGETEERYEMLKQVPGGPDKPEEAPDMGGCRGCRFWNVCQGGCPSSSINNDYRNRTLWCEAKYALYRKIEKDLRAVLPNIDLITDFPWDADLARKASRQDLDIKPFAAMRPDTEGRSSASGGAENPFGAPIERVSDQISDWDKKVKYYEEEYGGEVVEADRSSGSIHVDSKNPGSLPGAEEGSGSNWERRKREMREKHPENALEIDEENKYIYADSENSGSQDSETEQSEKWKKVEE
ncbi:MAG: radical SAM protein [Candidatus Nanohaloarchaea archaeon]